MAQRIYCCRKWRFSPDFTEKMIDSQMEDAQFVDLPHTVKETPFSYFDEHIYQMESCYQKNVIAPLQWQGKIIYLVFEAIGHASDVYINGQFVAHHDCGYTALTIDVTKALKYGQDNLITVRVDSNEDLNQPPFGYVVDYMTYGGIYRDVYFEIKEKEHFTDIFLQPSLLERINTSRLDPEDFKDYVAQGILKTHCYLSADAQKIAHGQRVFIRQYMNDKLLLSQPAENIEIEDKQARVKITSAPLQIKLWDVESPKLYTIKTQLLVDNEVTDEHVAEVGFKNARFEKEGFYLNGRKLKLRGLNRHQSYPYVGYAMPESMQRMDAKILKEELALNAVRTSHYPQSHYFIDECDRLGLLVFTEIPGWQHIGDEDWKDIAVKNTEDMIKQWRNHTSIILWGVRINESKDDDRFYQRTNEVAHRLDPTRQTGGVRCIANSHLFEDVYTYNDFLHSGDNDGCAPKEKITSNEEKAYLISEYNGHMYPTKAFDWEEHRREHAIRHANVLNAVAKEEDIAGSFGWCMFDYNTHKDFGSGDRICYHGVMDMFRNPKLAASVYSAFGEDEPVLEISSSFDIGEHPACNRGETYIISNADSVRMYKNNKLLKEYYPSDSKYSSMPHGPILINDFVGTAVEDSGRYKAGQAKLIKYCMNHVATNGMQITPKLVWAAVRLIALYGMKPTEAVPIYNEFVGDWGGEVKEYRFDAIKDGQVVKSVTKAAMTKAYLKANASHNLLTELHTYDVAEIRIKAVDENDNQLYYFDEPVTIEASGPIEIIGPSVIPLRGGAAGVYIRSTGLDGNGKVKFSTGGLTEPVEISVSVECLAK